MYPNYQKYVNDLTSNLSNDDKIYKNWCNDFELEKHLKNLKDVNEFLKNKKSQLITSNMDI